MIPFIDLNRKSYPLKNISNLLQSKRFIGGEPVKTLERKLSEKLAVKNCITCGNGTDALQLALRSYGIGIGDRVIIPEYTFWATAEAVVNVGAIPVTIDISARDSCMDYELFCQAIDRCSPRAAMLVHILGWCSADLKKFREICRERNIVLIEDGAQCFGTTINGESVYAGADCITTSFYPAKVLGGCGDGGAVFTKCRDHADLVRRLANHGRSDHYSHSEVGWNSRLDSINAQYIVQRLSGIDEEIEERRKIVRRYYEELSGESAIRCVQPPRPVIQNGYIFTIELDQGTNRDRVREALFANGISTAITYPVPLSLQPAFINADYESFSPPRVAENFGHRLLNLPLFPGLTDGEQAKVILALKSAIK